MLLIIYGTITAAIIFAFLLGIRIVHQTERGLIERLGKYRRFADPGFHWILPIVESMRIVDITEHMAESGKKEMITADNLNAVIDSIIFYKVRPDEVSVKASEYNVYDYEGQIIALAKTTLRSIIGGLSLKQANSERSRINTELMTILSKETESWGIEVVRAELKEIDPPEDVQETMNMIVKALNEKTAAVDFATATETKADGEKRAAIKNAEGYSQSLILKSEGERQAIETVAKGKAEATRLVNKAVEETFTAKAEKMRTIEALEKSLATNTKIIVPGNQSLINVVGDLVRPTI